MGWDPIELGVWVNHARETWFLDIGAGLADLKFEMDKRLIWLTWQKASRHHLGEGSAGGIAIGEMMSMYNRTIRHHPEDASALLRIWAGGWWTEARCSEVFWGTQGLQQARCHGVRRVPSFVGVPGIAASGS